MDETISREQGVFCLKFDGKMTFEVWKELEARVIDAMRRYTRLEVDLSEVDEVDLCGLHLIGLLQTVGTITAMSPAVEHASKRLLVSRHGTHLGRARKKAAEATC